MEDKKLECEICKCDLLLTELRSGFKRCKTCIDAWGEGMETCEKCGSTSIHDIRYCEPKEDVITCKNCGERFHKDVCHICERKEDIINKPNHYHNGGIDPNTYGKANFTKDEMNGFYKMNVIKYVGRAGKKDDLLQDLEKARWNLNQLIENVSCETNDKETHNEN